MVVPLWRQLKECPQELAHDIKREAQCEIPLSTHVYSLSYGTRSTTSPRGVEGGNVLFVTPPLALRKETFFAPNVESAISICYSISEKTDTWGSVPMLRIATTLLSGAPRAFVLYGLHVRRYGMDVDPIGSVLGDSESLVKTGLDFVLGRVQFREALRRLTELHVFDFTELRQEGCQPELSLPCLMQKMEHERRCCPIRVHFNKSPSSSATLVPKKYLCLDELCLKKRPENGNHSKNEPASVRKEPKSTSLETNNDDENPRATESMASGVVPHVALKNEEGVSCAHQTVRNLQGEGEYSTTEIGAPEVALDARTARDDKDDCNVQQAISCNAQPGDVCAAKSTIAPSSSPESFKLSLSSPSPSPSPKLASQAGTKKPVAVPEWGYGKYDWVMPCSDDIRPTSPSRSSTLVRAEDLLGAKELYPTPSFAELVGPPVKVGMRDDDANFEDSIGDDVTMSPRPGEDLGAFTERVCKLDKLSDEDMMKLREQESRLGIANGQKTAAGRKQEKRAALDAAQKAELERGSQDNANEHNKTYADTTEGGSKVVEANDGNDNADGNNETHEKRRTNAIETDDDKSANDHGDSCDLLLEKWLKQRW